MLIETKFSQKKRLSALVKVVFAATVWHVWKERNRRIFDSEAHSRVDVIRNIKDINIIMGTCNWKSDGTDYEFKIFGDCDLTIG